MNPTTSLLSSTLPSHGTTSHVADTPDYIHKAAKDFEAILIAQVLKSARESGGGMTGDADEEDETNSTMIELGEQQLAQALAGGRGLGIANMVEAGLKNHANR